MIRFQGKSSIKYVIFFELTVFGRKVQCLTSSIIVSSEWSFVVALELLLNGFDLIWDGLPTESARLLLGRVPEVYHRAYQISQMIYKMNTSSLEPNIIDNKNSTVLLNLRVNAGCSLGHVNIRILRDVFEDHILFFHLPFLMI